MACLATRRTPMSRRSAWASISARRGFFAPASSSTSRTLAASCSTAAATALMPAIHCFVLIGRGCCVWTAHCRAQAPPQASRPASILLLAAARRGATGRRLLRRPGRFALLAYQAEIDLALLHAGLQDDDPHRVAQPVLAPMPLATERLADRIERVVVMRQLGDMDQAVDLGLLQLDEQSEAGHPADHPAELAADVLLHPGRPVALVDLPLGILGTAGALGTLQRQLRHVARRIAELLRALAGERVLDGPVHQQVGIAPDRRGEVRIGFQCQAEVADVLRLVDRQRLAA